jgi:AbrB family looped-hinge helix DNA binding protein
MNSGQAPAIEKSKKKSSAADTAIKVGKRGSIIVPKPLVESFGYKEGDAFTVKSTKAGIRLVNA